MTARRAVSSTAGLALVLALGTSACGAGAQSADEPVTLTVFAAASLTDTFRQIGTEFEAENPDVRVRFSFGGSSDLVTQIRSGAPADVFAAADEATMGRATADDLTASAPVVFATNTLTIAVPDGNPGEVRRLEDLGRADLDVVVCAPEVPCGTATAKVETAAGVDVRPASEEQNVTDVLNKVATGEADAGLVYVTDIARARGAVTAVEFAASAAAANAYPIASIDGSDHLDEAQRFVDFVVGDSGQGVLADAGFGRP